MKSKTSDIILIILTLAVFAGISLWYSRLPFYVFIQDNSWKELGISSELNKLRISLLEEKTALKVLTVQYDERTEPENFSAEMLKAKGAKRIVLSPVVATGCNLLDFNIKEYFEGSEVVAITRDNSKNFFDKILIPDTEEIWKIARDYIGDASNVKICKTAKKLFNYFGSIDLSSDFHVIVDYKLVNAVPKKNLAGVVIPDFMDAFKRKFEEDSENLDYIFRIEKMEFEYTSGTNINDEDEEEPKGGLVQRVF